MDIKVSVADLYCFAEDAVDKILRNKNNPENFYQHAGELQLLLKILLEVEAKDNMIFALKRVLMILDRAGLYIDSPDSKATMAIVLPYLKKTRILLENAGGDDADNH